MLKAEKIIFFNLNYIYTILPFANLFKGGNSGPKPWIYLGAKAAGFLCLLGVILGIYLPIGMYDFLPPDSGVSLMRIYLSSFAGILPGALLCPFFLPVSSKERKPLGRSLAFILLAALPLITVSFLGLPYWFESPVIRIGQALANGLIQPLGFGLFYFTWLRLEGGKPSKSRSRASLALAAVIIGVTMVRQYAEPLLEAAGIGADPLQVMSFLWDLIKWLRVGLAVCALVCVALIDRCLGLAEKTAEIPPVKTNWTMILKLIGLMSVFTALNSCMNLQLFPFTHRVQEAFSVYLPLVAPIVLGLSLLAGKSTGRFLRFFLPPAIAVFILLPCLPLFRGHPWFLQGMSSLMTIVQFTLWSVGTTILMDQYRGRYWFYACGIAMHGVKTLSFAGYLLIRYIPSTPEMIALAAALAAIAFMLLSFKILFPSAERRRVSPEAPPAAEDRDQLFQKYGLTEREQEVAQLMAEGLENRRIADRLCLSRPAVSYHIGNIYRKFGIDGKRSGRAAFMRFFLSERSEA